MLLCSAVSDRLVLQGHVEEGGFSTDLCSWLLLDHAWCSCARPGHKQLGQAWDRFKTFQNTAGNTASGDQGSKAKLQMLSRMGLFSVCAWVDE